jgi:DNA replication protein
MPDRQLLSTHSSAGPVSLPHAFFTQLMPKIQDLAELKIVLYAAYVIVRKQGPSLGCSECSVTHDELKTEINRLWPELTDTTLRQALDAAVKHGALSQSTSNIDGTLQSIYSLTALMNRGGEAPAANIFALYEQNVGLITPMIAEELKEAERLYPPQWIEDAFKEAVTLNKRSWKYIARILERWASEGKDSGEYKRDTKKDGPDKYVKGKYGHLVKR